MTDKPTNTSDQPSERDKLQTLRGKMIDRALKMIDDDDLSASGFAALVKFLAEQGVTAPAAAPQPLPASTSDKLPFPASEADRGWKPMDNRPFIVA